LRWNDVFNLHIKYVIKAAEMLYTSKKSSEKLSLNFGIISEVFWIIRGKKKKKIIFSIVKFFWFMSIAVNFLKTLKNI
jgi:hypothetical protein